MRSRLDVNYFFWQENLCVLRWFCQGRSSSKQICFRKGGALQKHIVAGIAAHLYGASNPHRTPRARIVCSADVARCRSHGNFFVRTRRISASISSQVAIFSHRIFQALEPGNEHVSLAELKIKKSETPRFLPNWWTNTREHERAIARRLLLVEVAQRKQKRDFAWDVRTAS